MPRSASKRSEQRRPDGQQEQEGGSGCDEQLEPPRSAEEAGEQPDGAAEREHEEGELERQDLDDDEHEDQDQPGDPGVLGDDVHGADSSRIGSRVCRLAVRGSARRCAGRVQRYQLGGPPNRIRLPVVGKVVGWNQPPMSGPRSEGALT
jgi:hypothetical protein